MAITSEHVVELISPEILRCGQHDCLFLYKDARGEIHFSAVETGHGSGGVVIFPTAEEWPRKCPLHKEERGVIRERLCAYLRGKTQYSWIPQTLSDGQLTPRQAAFVAERYAYHASIRARANKSKLDGLILRMIVAPTVRLVWAVAVSLGVLACIYVIVVRVR